MEENYDIFSKLIKRKNPSVPDGFFEEFSKGILEEISSEDQAMNFSGVKKPEVPSDFFSSFYDNLKMEIDSEEAFNNLQIKKRSKPSVPLNFQKNFAEQIQTQTTGKKSNGRLLKITFWSVVSAAAAGLALLFILNTNETETTQPVAAVKEIDSEATDDTYMAYVDEADLIDYILENEINIEESADDDAVYDYVEQDIEEYYMDL